ncbi:HAD-IIA family hydrolase [Thermanaerothrix sp.]|jgi:4-nitrophenyl phosphatase|uniref:HAD-IIA family hydrolase n=1 Tax=Thermanaerothrix sp. TaxID=2972675 RepID=UPI002ADE1337|nr:HAD-IIA family hydrolase [Thermanaerothrix sp.]
MIQTLIPPVRALILDMDGVLWRGDQPIGNLPAIFETIQAQGLRVALATNNATRTAEQYAQKLLRFGVTFDPQFIVTSADATAYYLHQQFPQGGPIYLIGEEGLRQALAQYGFHPVEDGQVLAVVAGLDRQLTYEKLRRATLLIRQGIPFIGTNPDRTYPSPEGLVPGAGTVLAALEAASDVRPIIIGKPFPTLFRVALERLNSHPQETLVVGDRLDTDILGAQQAGLRAALVLSGVTTTEEARHWSPPPNLIAPTLAHLLGIEQNDDPES